MQGQGCWDRIPWGFIPWLLALALGATACGSRPEKLANVLLLVLDTTRADAVAAYGEGPAYTPTLDRLAQEGVLYTRARSTSAWTLPSHGSLFTGLFPSQHGAHNESNQLAPEQVTLAELLGTTHQTAGFSENPHITRAKGFSQGFDHFEETWRRWRTEGKPPLTVELIEAWMEKRDRRRPFFAFVNLMAPHLPYAPPEKWTGRFLSDRISPTEIQRFKAFGERHARMSMSGALSLGERELEILRGLYRAEVSFVDEQAGRILDILRAEGELGRTLVIVVGDHGENIGDHGLMEHQLCLYETLLRVPLILSLPGVIPAGRRDSAPVQLVDVMPTILEIAGLSGESWPPMEGSSLLAGSPPESRPVFAEYMRPFEQRLLFRQTNPQFDFTIHDRRLKSIQVGALKLIASDRGDVELYDVQRDPAETENLAERRGDLVSELLEQLERWSGGWEPDSSAGAPLLDEQTLEALRSLGYIR